jgi:hypothetical protein
MNWVATVSLVVLATCVGLYLFLSVTIFVTHLVETRPIRSLTPAPADDPEWSKLPSHAPAPAAAPDRFNPYEPPAPPGYAETMNRSAAGLGFTGHGLYAHAKGGTYKTHAAFWVSPSRATLCRVGWGTIAALNASRTILYTALDDGRYLVTSDKPTGAETPGLYEDMVVLGADFEHLARRHEERLRDSGRRAVPFEAEEALTDYEANMERRARFLVENGDAYFVDPSQSAIRSTIKGALKAFARTGRLPGNVKVERVGAGGARRVVPTVPAPLAWVGRLSYMAIFLGIFLDLRGRATTPRQQLFRLSLLGGGLFGLVLVSVLKAVLKRRSA